MITLFIKNKKLEILKNVKLLNLISHYFNL